MMSRIFRRGRNPRGRLMMSRIFRQGLNPDPCAAAAARGRRRCRVAAEPCVEPIEPRIAPGAVTPVLNTQDLWDRVADVHGAFVESGRDGAVHQMLQLQQQMNIIIQQMDAASAILQGSGDVSSSPVRDLG
jgi:hypothetical protein